MKADQALEKNQTDILNIVTPISVAFFIITFLLYIRRQKKNLAANEYENADSEPEGNIPHKKLMPVYIVYGLYFLSVLNAYQGEQFGMWKKIIPLAGIFPLVIFFFFNIITLTMGNPFKGNPPKLIDYIIFNQTPAQSNATPFLISRTNRNFYILSIPIINN
jgi:hypothetical protein